MCNLIGSIMLSLKTLWGDYFSMLSKAPSQAHTRRWSEWIRLSCTKPMRTLSKVEKTVHNMMCKHPLVDAIATCKIDAPAFTASVTVLVKNSVEKCSSNRLRCKTDTRPFYKLSMRLDPHRWVTAGASQRADWRIYQTRTKISMSTIQLDVNRRA